jgi:hypothetical protein
MKAYWVFGIAMAAGLSAQAEECAVTVYVMSGPRVPLGILSAAEWKAANMFREIGVEVVWRTGAVRAATADDVCRPPLVVQFDATVQARVAANALAYAMPFAQSGTCIHVLFERLLGGGEERLDTALLAHVLAHEITHVLERSDGHSAEGVMKAHWDFRDRRAMRFHPLAFAAQDVELIHRGLAKRAAIAHLPDIAVGLARAILESP